MKNKFQFFIKNPEEIKKENLNEFNDLIKGYLNLEEEVNEDELTCFIQAMKLINNNGEYKNKTELSKNIIRGGSNHIRLASAEKAIKINSSYKEKIHSEKISELRAEAKIKNEEFYNIFQNLENLILTKTVELFNEKIKISNEEIESREDKIRNLKIENYQLEKENKELKVNLETMEEEFQKEIKLKNDKIEKLIDLSSELKKGKR